MTTLGHLQPGAEEANRKVTPERSQLSWPAAGCPSHQRDQHPELRALLGNPFLESFGKWISGHLKVQRIKCGKFLRKRFRIMQIDPVGPTNSSQHKEKGNTVRVSEFH